MFVTFFDLHDNDIFSHHAKQRPIVADSQPIFSIGHDALHVTAVRPCRQSFQRRVDVSHILPEELADLFVGFAEDGDVFYASLCKFLFKYLQVNTFISSLLKNGKASDCSSKKYGTEEYSVDGFSQHQRLTFELSLLNLVYMEVHALQTVNIHEAKTNLSRLIDTAVTMGDSFIIAKSGKPLVRVSPLEHADADSKGRRLGFLKGQLVVPDDFDVMHQDEIVAMFDGAGMDR